MKPRPPLDPKRFWFDEASADLACDFFAQMLTHTKGQWRGDPFVLDDWQREQIIRPLFGWKKRDGKSKKGESSEATRAFRTAYVEIPRKAGKSSLGAGIALYMLFVDREPAAEVYSAAGDREQAAIIFEMAKTMVETNPKLMQRAEIFRRSITIPTTGSSYKVLSADAETKHGSSPSCILFDELHVQPNRFLFDALTTGTGARRQPLLIALTTAGFDRTSLCWEQHDYACKVRDGIIDDSTFLPVIYCAEEEDDWTSPEIWTKAHPGLGKSVQIEFLEAEAQKAKEVSAFENTFKRLYLNIWTEQSVRWMPMDRWDECNLGSIDPDALVGRDCYGGLDLATTTDIAALTLLFPPADDEHGYTVLPFFWVPAENIELRARRDRVDYRDWVRQGSIEATEGNVTDYDVIRAKINELGKQYNIREIAYDRWSATQLSTQLQGDGFTMVPFGQGFASMSAPTKELLALVLSQRLNHGGNPVLRWMASNAAAKEDPAGNIKLDKGKSTERIDGVVALAMSLGRAMIRTEESGSVYESDGIFTIGEDG